MKKRVKLCNILISSMTVLSLLSATVSVLALPAVWREGDSLREDADFSLSDMGDFEHFDVYYGENAATDGLEQADFSDHFSIGSGYLQHEFDVSRITDWWSTRDNYITRLVYTDALYRDFEMQVTCCGVENNVAYIWPMLVFGIENQTKSAQQYGGGFEVFPYNEGNTALKGFIDGSFRELTDPTTRHNSTVKDTNGFFEAQWFEYTMKLRVTGNTAVITIIPQYDWGAEYSYTYNLGDDYIGGYLGIASTSQNFKFKNLKIKDLGGEITERTPKEINTLGSADRLTGFDCYYSDDAHNGLTLAEDYTSYWEHRDSNSLWRTDASTHRLEWDTHKYISSMVYAERQYKNFELTVTLQRTEESGFGYMFPMVAFGVTDPTRYVDTPGGGIAAFATADGELCRWDSTVWDSSPAPASGYERTTPHTLKITVKYGVATFKLIGGVSEVLPDSYSFELPERYTGGYIALIGTANVCGFRDLCITELEDCDLTPANVMSVSEPSGMEVPLTTLENKLNLPEKLSVKCSNEKEYKIPVNWDISEYNRFVPGEYTVTGNIGNTITDDHVRVITNGKKCEVCIKVKGDRAVSPIRIACVGDGNTASFAGQNDYAQFLQELLGGEFIVKNFGAANATLLNSGDTPYTASAAYAQSMEFKPNIVVIMLGSNDVKSQNLKDSVHFTDDYKALIATYRELESHPTVYVALSPAVIKTTDGISNSVFKNVILPLEKKAASEAGCPVIDINTLTKGKSAWYTDGIHLNQTGCAKVAEEITKSVNNSAKIENVYINKSAGYLVEGESERFSLCFAPAVISGSRTAEWSSSDPSVATVKDGFVTALKKGSVTVSAVCQGKQALMQLTVYGKEDLISVPLTSNDDLLAFDCYYGENAGKGMEKQDSFSPYWSLSENGVERTRATIGDMKWGDTKVSSLVYSKRQFKNFKLTVDIHRTEEGEWLYPMVVFGIKDPTVFHTYENGGISVFASAEGELVASGQVEEAVNKWLSSAAPSTGYSREATHSLEITVEYNILTVKLNGVEKENMPALLVVELGDNDSEGYIALYGKANPCGFKNLTIRSLEGHDCARVKAEKFAGSFEDKTAEVGTSTDDIVLPKTAEVIGEDGVCYIAPVLWDFDGYNRFVRGTYTVKAYIEDSLQKNHVKLYSNDISSFVVITVMGDHDISNENEIRFDFNGKSELEGFDCYYGEQYGNDLQKCDPLKVWSIKDQRLQRIDHNFSTLGDWTLEKSQSEMASLVYKKRTFRNFELEVDFQRDGSSIYWAMVAFGIKDPTKLITQRDGGVAAYAEMEGRQIFWSADRSCGAHTTPYSPGFGYTDIHHLKLVVNAGTATMYLDDYSTAYSYMVPDSLREGYVSVMCNGNAANYDNLVIRALPDDETLNETGFDATGYPQLNNTGYQEVGGDIYDGVGFFGALSRTGQSCTLFYISICLFVLSSLSLGAIAVYKKKINHVQTEESL